MIDTQSDASCTARLTISWTLQFREREYLQIFEHSNISDVYGKRDIFRILFVCVRPVLSTGTQFERPNLLEGMIGSSGANSATFILTSMSCFIFSGTDWLG